MVKLLLADDSITIQKVVELILGDEGFEIKTADNGVDALSMLTSFKPDVVLADIEMPKMNGYQLCEKIKSNTTTRDVPVILLAGAFEPMDEELAKKVGADDFLVKPFESEDLISKINAFLMAVAGKGEEVAEVEAGGEDLWEVEEAMKAEAKAEAELEELVELAPLEEEELAITEALPEELLEEAILEEAVMPEEEVLPEPTMPAGVEIPAIGMPSSEVVLEAFNSAIKKNIAELMAGIDLKEEILKASRESIKATVESILWELAPELTERLIKEALKSALESLTKEVEKVIWETVPELAETIIKKEIEKIKAEM